MRLPSQKDARSAFVAYSYKIHPRDDYREVFKRVGAAFKVKFTFADEQISSFHILQKIANMIKAAQFSIFDVTDWNPNVTLELGLAYGYNEKVYIAFNPKRGASKDIPAYLGG